MYEKSETRYYDTLIAVSLSFVEVDRDTLRLEALFLPHLQLTRSSLTGRQVESVVFVDAARLFAMWGSSKSVTLLRPYVKNSRVCSDSIVPDDNIAFAPSDLDLGIDLVCDLSVEEVENVIGFVLREWNNVVALFGEQRSSETRLDEDGLPASDWMDTDDWVNCRHWLSSWVCTSLQTAIVLLFS